MQARLRRGYLTRAIALHRERGRDRGLRGRNALLRVLCPPAPLEQLRLQRGGGALALFVPGGGRPGGDLGLIGTIARGLRFAREPLAFAAGALSLDAPLRLSRRQLRGARLDLPQLGKDALELRARLCQRCRCAKLAFARPFELGPQRRQLLFEAGGRGNPAGYISFLSLPLLTPPRLFFVLRRSP